MNARNRQKARAKRERDPEFACRAMFAEIYAAQECDWDLQVIDASALVAEWLPQWLAQVGPDGAGRGPYGLRLWCERRLRRLALTA